jgi:hypothetical protein
MLDGRKVSNVPVVLHDSGPADGACNQAATTAPGLGTLAFADGTVIPFSVDFTSHGTEVDMTLYGERSGSAPAHATFATQRTGPDVAQDCGGGGAAHAPMDMSFTTDTPLASDPPPGAGGAGSGDDRAGGRSQRTGRAPRGRLRVTVSPRRVRAGRRTVFVFRVATAGRRPAVGAVVRFAGRRARVGTRGTARIVVTLRVSGRRAATVSQAGRRAARATIVVRGR